LTSSAPIVVQFKTPLPVTVRGQVPVTAHSALPVVEQHWPPPNFFEQYGFWISLAAALAAIAAALYSGLAYRLARRELEVVEAELGIIGKEADLRLSSIDSSDTVFCNPRYENTNDKVWFEFTFSLNLKNRGTKAVPEALIFFWLPPTCRPREYSPPGSEPRVRAEPQNRNIAGESFELFSYRVARRIYPYPFRTTEAFTFRFDENRHPSKAWIGPPEPVTIYWQIVCDDGTSPDPDEPAPFHIRFL